MIHGHGHGLKDVMILRIDFIVTSYMPTPSLQEEEHQTLPNLSWFGLNQEEALNGYPSSDICQSS